MSTQQTGKSNLTFNAFILLGVILFTSVLFAQTEWTKNEGNPVLTWNPSESWENYSVGYPCVLFDGTGYKMWYSGMGSKSQIGYAQSPDGVAWEKYNDNPVLKAGQLFQWDQMGVKTPVVLFDGAMYKMWYAGYKTNNSSAIGYATSLDGITWTKYENNPVLVPGSVDSWDYYFLNLGDVIFDGTIYKMWYDAQNSVNGIGYAESSDGINWQKYGGNPIMKPGESGTWDDRWIHSPDIMLIGDTYHMWYSGMGSESQIGYAQSQDGITWKKYNNNPVLDVVADTWESAWQESPSVVLQNDGQLQMWYLGGITMGTYAIGYATGTLEGYISDVSIKPWADNAPQEYSLSDSYPNPFNPTTTIEYDLPISGHARLAIYDILGHHIRTLVDTRHAAGHFQTVWNGIDELGAPSPAGMYFCRMEVGGSAKVIKLTLVK